MKKIMILIFLILTVIAYGKRLAPKEISPVSYNGKKYVVKHWSGDSVYKQNGGIIEVWNIKKNKLIKTVLIYKIQYNPLLESDVQDIFITSIRLNILLRR